MFSSSSKKGKEAETLAVEPPEMSKVQNNRFKHWKVTLKLPK
jgi:hypothetical protein